VLGKLTISCMSAAMRIRSAGNDQHADYRGQQ
jgi:hypothetical protein